MIAAHVASQRLLIAQSPVCRTANLLVFVAFSWMRLIAAIFLLSQKDQNSVLAYKLVLKCAVTQA